MRGCKGAEVTDQALYFMFPAHGSGILLDGARSCQGLPRRGRKRNSTPSTRHDGGFRVGVRNTCAHMSPLAWSIGDGPLAIAVVTL